MKRREPIARGAIDLKALTLAAAVAASGSIRLAAREARMTAPTVSRRIRSLEDGLGVSLFERRSTGLRLTEAGAQFLEAIRRLLSELEIATDRAREVGTAAVGRVVVGTYFSLSRGRLRDALIRFAQRHHGISLLVMENRREALLQAVRDGRADLALLLGPNQEPGLDKLALWLETAMVALPLEHPLAGQELIRWRDLAAETFVIRRRGPGPEARAKVEALLPAAHSARFLEQDISREGMFNLVGAGLGVAVLAESAAGVRYPGVLFRPVGDETGPTMIEAAAYWDPKRDNPAFRRFLALLRAAQGDASSGEAAP